MSKTKNPPLGGFLDCLHYWCSLQKRNYEQKHCDITHQKIKSNLEEYITNKRCSAVAEHLKEQLGETFPSDSPICGGEENRTPTSRVRNSASTPVAPPHKPRLLYQPWKKRRKSRFAPWLGDSDGYLERYSIQIIKTMF